MNLQQIAKKLKEKNLYISLRENEIFGGLSSERDSALQIDIVQKPFWIYLTNDVITIRFLSYQVSESKTFKNIEELSSFILVKYPDMQ
jgi:hypothetical protein